MRIISISQSSPLLTDPLSNVTLSMSLPGMLRICRSIGPRSTLFGCINQSVHNTTTSSLSTLRVCHVREMSPLLVLATCLSVWEHDLTHDARGPPHSSYWQHKQNSISHPFPSTTRFIQSLFFITYETPYYITLSHTNVIFWKFLIGSVTTNQSLWPLISVGHLVDWSVGWLVSLSAFP